MLITLKCIFFPSEWLWMAVLTGVIVILSTKGIWIAPVQG